MMGEMGESSDRAAKDSGKALLDGDYEWQVMTGTSHRSDNRGC